MAGLITSQRVTLDPGGSDLFGIVADAGRMRAMLLCRAQLPTGVANINRQADDSHSYNQKNDCLSHMERLSVSMGIRKC